MGDTLERHNDGDDLRQQAEKIAEAIASGPQAEIEPLGPNGLGILIHELLVHKLELEMQNEELRRSQAELDVQRALYFDLYDLSPVGYCSVSEHGLILSANLTVSTLLGVPRSVLVEHPFTRFILDEDQDIYYQMRKHLLETGQPQTCEFRMVKQDLAQFWVGLSATVALDNVGAQVCRLFISDVSDRKRAEDDLQRILEEKEVLLRRLSAGSSAT